MMRLYRSTKWVGWAQVSFSAQQLDIPAARLASPGISTGQYAAVARWTQPVVLLASAAASTTLRDASAAGSDSGAVSLTRANVRRPFILACVASIVAAVGAYIASPVVLGSGYDGAKIPAVILFAGAPFSFLSQVMINLLIARHRDRVAGLGAAIFVLAQLLCVFPLTKLLGAAGPALACTSMQISYCAYLRHHIREMEGQ